MNRARLILAIILTYVIFAMLLNSVGTLILMSQQALGASMEQASFLDGFKDVTIAVVAFIATSLLPRLGYRHSMMLGLGLVTLACVAMPIANAYWMVQVMLVAVGAGFALAKMAIYSSIGLITEGKKAHASLMNFVEGCFMLGVLAWPWILAQFVQRQSDAADPIWLNVYWYLAAACVITIVLLATTRIDEHQVRARTSSPIADLIRLLALPLVVVFLVSAFLSVLIEQGINTWLPSFNHDVLHLSTVVSLQITSLFAAATAVGRLGAGLILRYLPWHWLLASCLLAMAALILVAMPMAAQAPLSGAERWTQAPAAAFVLPLIGLFMAPIYPAINSAILSALPVTRHAAMTGLIVLFSALGGTTGSLMTGQLFARFDGPTAFYLLLAPMALLLIGVMVLHRHISAAPALVTRVSTS